MIGRKLAHYEILEKIGAGGMGDVYRARDAKLGRDIAIKILPADLADDPERRGRFKREAQSIAALKHPNIITIYSVEEADGVVFLTMELVDGENLSQLLPKDGLPLNKIFDIAVPLADAINSANVAGITHRDLKPANIMVDTDGRVKVLDFGLAKPVTPAEAVDAESATVADGPATQEGRVLGTIPYMSPEQAEGKPVDHRSDIFSLGIILYEMATGERPFKGESSLSIMSSILRDTPVTVTEIRRQLPVQFGRIVQHCLEKNPNKRFQNALDIANELEALRIEVTSATGSIEAIRRPKPRVNKKVGFAGAAVFVALLAALIFKPFSVEIKPDQTATASLNNTMAVMYFDNLVDAEDPKRYGEIVSELLITGLSESEQLRVVSSQRLYDILKQLGREGEKSIDRSTATAVAKQSQARWMVQGSILQTEPNFVVTSQIVDVATGNVAASQRTTGEPGETIFSLVDRITQETLEDLSAPLEINVAAAPRVAGVSTNSEEAYRNYLEGIEFQRKYFRQEARESFKRATQLDSTFAMAYFYLAQESHGDEGKKAIQRAVHYADRATRKERLYIAVANRGKDDDMEAYKKSAEFLVEAYPDDKYGLTALLNYYTQVRTDTKKGIDFANRIVEIDPADKTIYNRLAYLHDSNKDLDRAIAAINKYIELAPGEPNPYDTRGDIYSRNGRLDDAIASYTRSVEIKPDFFDYASVIKLGSMYIFKENYDEAATQFRKLFASDDASVRAQGRSFLCALPATQGQIAETIRRIDAAISTDDMEGYTYARAGRLEQRAYMLHLIGKSEEALAEMKRSHEIDESKSQFDRMQEPLELAAIGAINEAEAALEKWDAKADSLQGLMGDLYSVAKGLVSFKRKDYASAIEYLQIAKRREWTSALDLLAQVHIDAGQSDAAIPLLEKVVTNYSVDRGGNDWAFARQHYYLAIAYQNVGRNDDAIKELQTFLRLWKDADEELPQPHDARKRLDDLTRSS